MDREKVVKRYTDFVNGFIPSCASDDYELEMHKAVLALLEEQEQKTGNWISEEDYDEIIYKCSVCDEPWVLIEGTPFDNGMKYCPNCGAKMGG